MLLDPSKETDSITFDTIPFNNESYNKNFVVGDGKILTDGSETYSGTLSSPEIWAVAGNTLKLYDSLDNAYSLTLDDGINVDFFIDIPYYGAEGGYIEYSYLETTDEQSAARKTYTVNGEDLEVQSDGTRKLRLKAAPAQIAEDYIITVFDADGNEKDTITASIEEYCNAIMSNESFAAYQDIAQSLLNYGALADEYFGYAALSEAVTGKAYAVSHSENYKADVEDFRSKARSAVITQGSVQIVNVAYVAQMEPEFRFYLSGITEGEAAALAVKVDSGLTAKTVKTEKGICVRVTGLKASQFGTVYTLRVGDTVLEYNGYANLYTAINCSNDESLVHLAKGVYRYATAVKAMV